jgi:hypothetical protein
VGGAHFRAHLLVADGEEHAHALRSRVRQIEGSDSRSAGQLPKRPPIAGMESTQKPAQLDGLDRTAERELPTRRSDPLAPSLLPFDVVVLEPLADTHDDVDATLRLVEVVPGLAGDELADREHLEDQAVEEPCRSIWRHLSTRRVQGCVCSRRWCFAGEAGIL